MIQLGLRRAAQLFRSNPQPWHAVHVAGTNGKGTVCRILSALLTGHGLKCGRFTSPHLIHRWDCISIDEQPVREELFKAVEAEVLRRNEAEKIGASEFEILTATAFDIFTREKVDIGVVEVGMGGRDDATNILRSKALAILTSIGLDHQKFLGDTIEEIARHKSGIFMKDVPILIDPAVDLSVREVVDEEATRVNAGPVMVSKREIPSLSFGLRYCNRLRRRQPLRYSMSQAYEAFKFIYITVLRLGTKKGLQAKTMRLKARDIIKKAARMNAGRMQWLDLTTLFPNCESRLRSLPVLLDGAHNIQAAEALARFVLTDLRSGNDDNKITWIIASTQGRDLTAFLRPFLNKGDHLAAVEFGPVDGMPWVRPLNSSDVASAAAKAQPGLADVVERGRDIREAIKWSILEKQHPVVITGSLYLAADVYRLLIEAHDGSTEFDFAKVHLVHRPKIRPAKLSLHEDS